MLFLGRITSLRSPLPAVLARSVATDAYLNRHLGPTQSERDDMLKIVGRESLHHLLTSAIPKDILRSPMTDFPALSETEVLSLLKNMGEGNTLLKSMIGQGYYECVVPQAIIRNVLENPMWYTPYTPYQAEISQGRLESLLNFQTMVASLTSMAISNASLLDQATAAAECMHLSIRHHRQRRKTFFVDEKVFLPLIELIKTHAVALNVKVEIGTAHTAALENCDLAGILVQSPDNQGMLHDFTALFAEAKRHGVLCCASVDLMASCLVKPPGEMGADVVIGTSQRFGTPLGYGGPHAGFMAVRDEYKRLCPGRIVGISKDSCGDPAICMVLQTREQHIKRERATSNICTAQALLANMSAFYAIYHGSEGLKRLSSEIHQKTKILALGLHSLGYATRNKTYFDTLTIDFKGKQAPETYAQLCREKGINIFLDKRSQSASISVDEATTLEHIRLLLEAGGMSQPDLVTFEKSAKSTTVIPTELQRSTKFLQEAVFNVYKSETELMRYIQRLQRKDFGLTHGMIPLGSCTMKLNSAAAMRALSWPEYNALHPYVPDDQARGYRELCTDLMHKLCVITGMEACSLQPNSGANGEYCGLRVIRAYHESRGDTQRLVCLIPTSAHGTNAASATMAGLQVVAVRCLEDGCIDYQHLEELCNKHSTQLACLMNTYPSTYGLFDKNITEVTSLIHRHGGQCYIDGANMNAFMGYSAPGFIGGDVCHLNLHKTFSIPHGGGGPGAGPITVRQHLAPFLPRGVYGPIVGGAQTFGQVSQASYGSASILTISYALIRMLGSSGLKAASEYAVLNANYIKKRLENSYAICFLGNDNYCAHEFILDVRPFKKTANITIDDVAKRLIDYGFHAPTLSFPIAGTFMIEPTESESKLELDRFIDALICIRAEIAAIERGEQPLDNNVLKNSPHAAKMVMTEEWKMPYSRMQAAFPTKHQLIEKYWPTTSRIDNTYGNLSLFCSCPPLGFYN